MHLGFRWSHCRKGLSGEREENLPLRKHVNTKGVHVLGLLHRFIDVVTKRLQLILFKLVKRVINVTFWNKWKEAKEQWTQV